MENGKCNEEKEEFACVGGVQIVGLSWSLGCLKEEILHAYCLELSIGTQVLHNRYFVIYGMRRHDGYLM